MKKTAKRMLSIVIVLISAAAATPSVQAQTLTTLYSFRSQPNCTDGGNPTGLIQGINGNFDGTTVIGGEGNNGRVSASIASQ